MKQLLAYLMFVGLPLGGLLAVLDHGKSLRAPMAVHGDWHISRTSVDGEACLSRLLVSNDSIVTVQQSGPRLEGLTANGIALLGQLDGQRIALDGRVPRALRTTCAGADSIRLEATIDRGSSPWQLQGQLRQLGCATCPVLEFRAVLPGSSARVNDA